jgi:hypothetical protein
MTELSIRQVRARPPGAVLGSGLTTTPRITGGADILNGPDPLQDLIDRLEHAGATLLALPATGPSTRLRMTRYDCVQDAVTAYGWQPTRLRPPHPSNHAIDQMDESWSWLALIPEGQAVIRRIVGARALVHPITLRHLYPWRRLATLLGADHKSVQRWHKEGLRLILAGLALSARVGAERAAAWK